MDVEQITPDRPSKVLQLHIADKPRGIVVDPCDMYVYCIISSEDMF